MVQVPLPGTRRTRATASLRRPVAWPGAVSATWALGICNLLGIHFEPLVIVGVIYFIMTFVLSKVFGHFERKMKKADRNNGYGRKRKQQREVHI